MKEPMLAAFMGVMERTVTSQAAERVARDDRT
jgi:hypothetical protein